MAANIFGTGTGARLALAAAALTLLAGTARAEDEWTLQLTPYVLIPSVEATLGYQAPGGSPDVGAGPTDWLELINAVAMLQAEARRGRVFVTFDWMYLDMGNVESAVRSVGFPDGTVPIDASANLTTDATFDGWMVTLSGGYRVVDGEDLDLGLYGGLRTLNLTSGVRWELTASVTSPGGSHTFPASGAVEVHDETWDAVVGARGTWRFGERFGAFALADLGRGDGTESAQWTLGASWRFASTSVELSWRDIRWRGLFAAERGELALYGPVVGATFRF
jgi:hypothetical protein